MTPEETNRLTELQKEFDIDVGHPAESLDGIPYGINLAAARELVELMRAVLSDPGVASKAIDAALGVNCAGAASPEVLAAEAMVRVYREAAGLSESGNAKTNHATETDNE